MSYSSINNRYIYDNKLRVQTQAQNIIFYCTVCFVCLQRRSCHTTSHARRTLMHGFTSLITVSAT